MSPLWRFMVVIPQPLINIRVTEGSQSAGEELPWQFMTVLKSESAAMHFTHILVYDVHAFVYLNTHTQHTHKVEVHMSIDACIITPWNYGGHKQWCRHEISLNRLNPSGANEMLFSSFTSLNQIQLSVSFTVCYVTPQMAILKLLMPSKDSICIGCFQRWCNVKPYISRIYTAFQDNIDQISESESNICDTTIGWIGVKFGAYSPEDESYFVIPSLL